MITIFLMVSPLRIGWVKIIRQRFTEYILIYMITIFLMHLYAVSMQFQVLKNYKNDKTAFYF